jgi:hypothetical protein
MAVRPGMRDRSRGCNAATCPSAFLWKSTRRSGSARRLVRVSVRTVQRGSRALVGCDGLSADRGTEDDDAGKALSNDALAAIARQRAVLATIADVIVAAAQGKSLRVTIHVDPWGDDAFADRLTQALLARGRDCRCPPTVHESAPSADHLVTPGQAGGRRTAVISCRRADHGDTDVCRIDIQVDASTRPAGPIGGADCLDPGGRETGEFGDSRAPDVIVDYLDPAGPIIRHLASWLAPSARR